MKKHKEKELNAFLEKTTKALELERAPKNFVNSVMQQVEVRKANASNIAYTPLVSSTIWVGIALMVVIVFGFLTLESNPVTLDWFSTLKINTVGTTDFLDTVSKSFSVSDSTIYALVGLLVFMGVQVWYLKRFFAQRQVLL